MSEPEQFIAKTSGDEAIEHNEQVPSVGAQLAYRRQQHGWSVDDVANQLKLAPRQIDAIEADNYAALPTIVMTRGYIRSYAKMLGLDPATILPSTVPVAAERTQILGRPRKTTFYSESRRTRVPYKWIFGGIALVLAGVLATQFGAFSALRQSSAPPATAVAPHAAQETARAASSAELAPPLPAASSPAQPANVPATADAEPQQPAPAPAAAPAAAAGANQLSLTFKQDSWVEIRRADKSTLYSRVGKAGSTETFDIDQPVSVVIGNLAGVAATLRGVALDLKAGAKGNVARLNLK